MSTTDLSTASRSSPAGSLRDRPPGGGSLRDRWRAFLERRKRARALRWSPKHRKPRPLAWRIARGVLIAIASVYGLYLVAANLLLMTGWMARIISSDRLHVTYDRAWTFVPFRLHITNLRIHVVRDDVQAVVSFDRVSARFHPFLLAKSIFRASDIEGTGASVLVRQARWDDDPIEARRRGLPEMPAEPPKEDAPKSEDEGGGEKKEPWTIQLEALEAGVKEIWIDHEHLFGALHLQGGVDWKTGESMDISRTTLTFEDAKVEIAGEPAAEPVVGRLVADFDRFVQSEASVESVLATLDAELLLSAGLPSLATYGFFVPKDTLEIAAGSGTSDVHLVVSDGRLDEDSFAKIDLEDVELRFRRFAIGFSGDARYDELSEAFRVCAAVTGGVHDAKAKGGAPPVISQEGAACGSWPRGDLIEMGKTLARSRPRGSARAVVSVADLAAFHRFVTERPDPSKGGKQPMLAGGSARLVAETRAHGAVQSIKAELASRKVSLVWKDYRGRGDVLATTSGTVRREGDALHFQGQGGVRVERFQRDRDQNSTGEYDGDFQARAIDARVGEGASFLLAGRGRLANARPILDLPPLDDAIPDVVTEPMDLDDVTAEAGLFVKAGVFEILIHQAVGDAGSTRGRIVTNGKETDGAMLVEKGPIRVGVLFDKKTDVDLQPGDDFAAHHMKFLHPELLTAPRPAARAARGDKKRP